MDSNVTSDTLMFYTVWKGQITSKQLFDSRSVDETLIKQIRATMAKDGNLNLGSAPYNIVVSKPDGRLPSS